MDDSKLRTLPPMKRFSLLQHRLQSESNPPVSPSRFPAKKRKLNRNPVGSDENLPPEMETVTQITPPTPFCLPTKKRVWAFQPEFTPANILPNCLPAKKRVWAFQPEVSTINTAPPFSEIDLNVVYTPSPEKTKEEDEVHCSVCESTDGDPIDPIVFCDGCDLMVHSTCYGNPLMKSIPEGDWFCALCLSSDDVNNKRCCLCPVSGGAMKRTKDEKWAHIVCAVLVPEVFFEDCEGRDGIDWSKVPKRRFKEVCYLCRKKNGCVVECSEIGCSMSFHVTCGLKEELCIELKERKGGCRGGGGGGGGGIVAAFCRNHTNLWKKQQRTGKFKIVARNDE